MFSVPRVKNYVVNYHMIESIAEMRWGDTGCLGHVEKCGRAQLYRGSGIRGWSLIPGSVVLSVVLPPGGDVAAISCSALTSARSSEGCGS